MIFLIGLYVIKTLTLPWKIKTNLIIPLFYGSLKRSATFFNDISKAVISRRQER
jgi:hypothetical protein